jgi:hypothetical protein
MLGKRGKCWGKIEECWGKEENAWLKAKEKSDDRVEDHSVEEKGNYCTRVKMRDDGKKGKGRVRGEEGHC